LGKATAHREYALSDRQVDKPPFHFRPPPFASRGIQPALKFFDKVFGSFQSCKVDILEMDVVVKGSMGLVCTIQRVSVVLKTGDAKTLVVRETDCFEKRNGEWKLIHQHASVPAGGRLGRQSQHGPAQRRESEGPQRLRLTSQKQSEGLRCPKYGW
jgi:hypothetical protein